jgi:hypothetical protein
MTAAAGSRIRLIVTEIRESRSILASPNIAFPVPTRAWAGMTAEYGSMGASNLWHPRHCYRQNSLPPGGLTQTSHRNRQFARPQLSHTQPMISTVSLMGITHLARDFYYPLNRLTQLHPESHSSVSAGPHRMAVGPREV